MTKPGRNKGVRVLHPAEQSPRASPRELAEVRRAGGVWASIGPEDKLGRENFFPPVAIPVLPTGRSADQGSPVVRPEPSSQPLSSSGSPWVSGGPGKARCWILGLRQVCPGAAGSVRRVGSASSLRNPEKSVNRRGWGGWGEGRPRGRRSRGAKMDSRV